MNICNICLKIIPDGEMCFEAWRHHGSKKVVVTLCRLCFFGNEQIPSKVKKEFAYYEQTVKEELDEQRSENNG